MRLIVRVSDHLKHLAVILLVPLTFVLHFLFQSNWRKAMKAPLDLGSKIAVMITICLAPCYRYFSTTQAFVLSAYAESPQLMVEASLYTLSSDRLQYVHLQLSD